MPKRPLPFYGWTIIGIAILSGTLIYGVRHSFSVFFPQILNEFGWSRGSTALMLSLNVLVYGLVSPIAGRLGDRWKPQKIMTIGIIIIFVFCFVLGMIIGNFVRINRKESM